MAERLLSEFHRKFSLLNTMTAEYLLTSLPIDFFSDRRRMWFNFDTSVFLTTYFPRIFPNTLKNQDHIPNEIELLMVMKLRWIRNWGL